MGDKYFKIKNSTNVLQGSTTGFIQAAQTASANQMFSPSIGSLFGTMPCANALYCKYFPTEGVVKLVSTPMGDNAQFRVQSNGTDDQIFCKGYNNGNSPLTIAGASLFDVVDA